MGFLPISMPSPPNCRCLFLHFFHLSFIIIICYLLLLLSFYFILISFFLLSPFFPLTSGPGPHFFFFFSFSFVHYPSSLPFIPFFYLHFLAACPPLTSSPCCCPFHHTRAFVCPPMPRLTNSYSHPTSPFPHCHHQRATIVPLHQLAFR